MNYFTSDRHLWHENVLLFDKDRWDIFLWKERRKEINNVRWDSSKTTEEIKKIREPYLDEMVAARIIHDEYILWEIEKLSGNDVLYFLWDMCFSRDPEYKQYLRTRLMSMKCIMHWVYGNHDHRDYIKYFWECFKTHWHYKTINTGQSLYCMMHYPIASWNKQAHWSFMLHWHCHQNLFKKIKQNKILMWIANLIGRVSIISPAHRIDVSYNWGRLLWTEKDLLSCL